MIPINKHNEPAELTNYKQVTDRQHWDYNALGKGEKSAIQHSLCAEQGYICAYCMQRIAPSGDSMRIEHWTTQASNRVQSVDYNNMLGCCKGEHEKVYHCDTFRGHVTPAADQQLKYNPANPSHHASLGIYYNFVTGEVHSSDADFNTQLSKVLNLNNPYLCEKRKNVVIGIVEVLSQDVSVMSVANVWGKLDAQGKYKEFCDVVIKYLSQHTATTANTLNEH